MKLVPLKDRKSVAADLKKIYGALTLPTTESELEEFAKKWDKSYPVIAKQWRTNLENLSTFFDDPPDIRKSIYTNNAIDIKKEGSIFQ